MRSRNIWLMLLLLLAGSTWADEFDPHKTLIVGAIDVGTPLLTFTPGTRLDVMHGWECVGTSAWFTYGSMCLMPKDVQWFYLPFIELADIGYRTGELTGDPRGDDVIRKELLLDQVGVLSAVAMKPDFSVVFDGKKLQVTKEF